MTEHDDRIDMILASLTRVEEAINGNGKPGIKTRLDRLEQWIEGRKWAEKLVLTGVIGALLLMAWKVLTMHPEALTAPLAR